MYDHMDKQGPSSPVAFLGGGGGGHFSVSFRGSFGFSWGAGGGIFSLPIKF